MSGWIVAGVLRTGGWTQLTVETTGGGDERAVRVLEGGHKVRLKDRVRWANGRVAVSPRDAFATEYKLALCADPDATTANLGKR